MRIISSFIVMILTATNLSGCASTNVSNQSMGNTVGNITNMGFISSSSKDDWIYYANTNDQNKLYKMKADGSNPTKITDDQAYDLNVVDDWIYYRALDKNAMMYKMKTDGTSKTQLTKEPSGYINVVDDWIYYSDYSGYTPVMYKMKTDGSGKQKITDDYSEQLLVLEPYVFYRNGNDDSAFYRIKNDGSSK